MARRQRVYFLCILLSLVSTLALGQSREIRTPLHWAARHGLVEIAGELLEAGADIDRPDILGRTPLHLAVRHPSMVSFLVAEGATLNPRDHLSNTPLHAAIWVQSAETVEILLAAGANAGAQNTGGYTPLDLAIRNGTSRANRRMVSSLVRAGAR
jgi:ankyrin repeat protein